MLITVAIHTLETVWSVSWKVLLKLSDQSLGTWRPCAAEFLLLPDSQHILWYQLCPAVGNSDPAIEGTSKPSDHSRCRRTSCSVDVFWLADGQSTFDNHPCPAEMWVLMDCHAILCTIIITNKLQIIKHFLLAWFLKTKVKCENTKVQMN